MCGISSISSFQCQEKNQFFKNITPCEATCYAVALAAIVGGVVAFGGCAAFGGVGAFASTSALPQWLAQAVGTIGYKGNMALFVGGLTLSAAGGISGIILLVVAGRKSCAKDKPLPELVKEITAEMKQVEPILQKLSKGYDPETGVKGLPQLSESEDQALIQHAGALAEKIQPMMRQIQPFIQNGKQMMQKAEQEMQKLQEAQSHGEEPHPQQELMEKMLPMAQQMWPTMQNMVPQMGSIMGSIQSGKIDDSKQEIRSMFPDMQQMMEMMPQMMEMMPEMMGVVRGALEGKDLPEATRQLMQSCLDMGQMAQSFQGFMPMAQAMMTELENDDVVEDDADVVEDAADVDEFYAE